jgi:hypothetical protein
MCARDGVRLEHAEPPIGAHPLPLWIKLENIGSRRTCDWVISGGVTTNDAMECVCG